MDFFTAFQRQSCVLQSLVTHHKFVQAFVNMLCLELLGCSQSWGPMGPIERPLMFTVATKYCYCCNYITWNRAF